MDFGAFLRYWSLTLAVFVFYLFAVLVASLDAVGELAEQARKRRGERKGPALDPNPLAGRTVAETIFPGPGQRLDAKREWVARLAEDVLRRVRPSPPVRFLVLEDSMGHPLVQFSNGTRVESYRVDKAVLAAAMAGDSVRLAEVTDLLTRHVTADFLGREEVRPPRTTELAREARGTPGAAAEAPARPRAAASPSATVTQAAPSGPAAPAAPAPPAAAASARDVESMSREERLAAARARAETLKTRGAGGAAPAPQPEPTAAPQSEPAPAGVAAPQELAAPAAATKPEEAMTREERLAAARAKLEALKARQAQKPSE